MSINLQETGTELYERDYCLWLKKIAQNLHKGELDELDIHNLIAEIVEVKNGRYKVI